ncbi:hypothetical protein SAMN05421759_102654 [Roseivivax lentus]|uniref:Uncharacterized protein n=1 Tax=Roseivivax lentus TaxID=633194 RepID=A0A1N7LFB7_9RHOB|nr:hypothetical protein [Roseivivax lentus]SIS72500.1 hypothetical protein SAMN05421759_102654 [Roseivivax lentus]
MSAPDTNVEKEEKRHRHALLGIRASLAYGVGLLAIFTIWVISASNEDKSGVAGPDTAGSSMISGDTEGTALDGYEADGYEPGGNSTGTVTLQGE